MRCLYKTIVFIFMESLALNSFFLIIHWYESDGNLVFLKPFCLKPNKEELIIRSVIWKGKGERNYRVFYNFAPAEWKNYHGNEKRAFTEITFTTHGTQEYLNNVLTVVKRWQGPISLAVYAPGEDFQFAAKIIDHLRTCGPVDIQKFVAFHLFHEEEINDTKNDITVIRKSGSVINCSEPLPLPEMSYRKRQNLTYPVNAARNIARSAAGTRYVLASDLELYPSVGLIDKFSDFISNVSAQNSSALRVYVLPIFEVEKHTILPHTKQQLVSLIAKGKAVTFHRFTCLKCHQISREEEWLKQVPPDSNALKVFYIAESRQYWEPIYIGTHDEPLYDERLSWEGMDKRLQMYEMCLRGYELHILDSAFLVHVSGIKKFNAPAYNERMLFVGPRKNVTKDIIREIHARYTQNAKCKI